MIEIIYIDMYIYVICTDCTLKSPELLIYECGVMHTHKHVYLESIDCVSIPLRPDISE